MNASLKSAVAKIAERVVAQGHCDDWRKLARQIIRDLPARQRFEVARANEFTFQSMLSAALSSS